MALILKQVVTDDFTSIRSDGSPGKTKALQVFDTDTNEVIFTFNHASDGTATAEVDASQCVTEDTVSIKSASVTLTDAQIKTLPTTPVQVVAGQAGKILRLVAGVAVADCAAGEYTNITVGTIADASLSITTSADDNLLASNLSDSTNILGTALVNGWMITPYTRQSTDTNYVIDPNPGAIAGSILGEGLFVQAYNDDGNFTGGNAANNMTIKLAYMVFDA